MLDTPTKPPNVDFSEAGRSRPLLREGFSGQERDFVWTVGPHSRLVLPEAHATILVLNLSPCLAEGLVTAQHIEVQLNGTNLGWQRITRPTQLRCPIPPGVLKPGHGIELVLKHPCFLRLDRLDMGAEDRPLALCLSALHLHADTPPPPGAAVLDLLPHPAAPPTAESLTHRFAQGKGHAYLGEGWHTDEAGLVWTAAPISRLRIPAPPFPGPLILRIGLAPLVIGDFMPGQRVAIVAGGLMLGQFDLRHETALALPLPQAALADGEALEIALYAQDALPMRQFHWPDPDQALGVELAWISLERPPHRARAAAALRGDGLAEPPAVAVSGKFLDLPADDLRAAIQAELGITAAELMRQFESLGGNCAFGFAQREAGAEVLGLLRFANTPIQGLLCGLSDRFQAASQKAEIEMYLQPDIDSPEYRLRIARYGIRWHTMVKEADSDAETVFAEQTARLGFLRRKFEEGLRAGRKIYAIARAPLVLQVPVPGYDPLPYGLEGRGTTHVLPAWDPPQTYEVVLDSLSGAEAQAVFLELNRSRPNTLLYFVLAAPGAPSGMVELLAPGLMRGTISSLFANDLDWLRVAANAWLLNRDANAAFRTTETA